MNITKIQKDEMLRLSKDSWLSAMFSAIPYVFSNITFNEQKEIFFLLLREWLESGIVKFDTPPTEDFVGQSGFWNADNKSIMSYLYNGFPKDAVDEFDEDVNLYFYIVAPPVNWLQEDGSYNGS